MVEATKTTILGKRTHSQVSKERKKSETITAAAAKVEKEPFYEVRDGLRFVRPYRHEFKTFAKRRWID